MTNNFKNINIEKRLIYGLLAIMLILFIQQCTTNSRLNRVLYNIETVNQKVQRIDSTVFPIEEFQYIIDINGYEVSYRMLYDNNTVVRTTQRPDDIMKKYTDKIKVLQKELTTLKNAK